MPTLTGLRYAKYVSMMAWQCETVSAKLLCSGTTRSRVILIEWEVKGVKIRDHTSDAAIGESHHSHASAISKRTRPFKNSTHSKAGYFTSAQKTLTVTFLTIAAVRSFP